MKFNAVFADGMSGSVGGVTASRNAAGQYFRTKAIPVNPNTLQQQMVRSAFGSLVNAWVNDLTEAQRDAWRAYGAAVPVIDALGNQIFVKGQNWYIGNNAPRLQASLARIDDAPTIFDTGAPVTNVVPINLGTPTALALDNGETTLGTTALISGGASTSGTVLFYLGDPINPSRTFFKGPYQLATALAVAPAATSSPDATAIASMLNVNTPIATGQYRSARFRISYDDGRLSQPFEFLSTVLQDSI